MTPSSRCVSRAPYKMIVFRSHKVIVCFSTRNEAAKRSKKSRKYPLYLLSYNWFLIFFPAAQNSMYRPRNAVPVFFYVLKQFQLKSHKSAKDAVSAINGEWVWCPSLVNSKDLETHQIRPKRLFRRDESIVLLTRFCRLSFYINNSICALKK